MVKIRTSKPTTLQLLEAPMHVGDKRTYLGMSGLGHSCMRYLWLTFRWAYDDEFSDRLRRLFKRGHREEPAIIEELERIGIKVEDAQEEFVTGFGHVKGHCDGKCYSVPEAPKTPHILEIKTMSDKYFKDVCKKGVKESKPIYYAQAQLYMLASNFSRCLFIAVNKNDDAYYVERIYFNQDHASDLASRGESIVLSQTPPPKVFQPTWFECKFCSAKFICHQGRPMNINCRTCEFIELGNNGTWWCKGETELDNDVQLKGCNNYSAIEV